MVSLHPFDDGNGRIAHGVGDLLLARADGNTQRSLSAQIAGYYDILEIPQKGTLDITHWLGWFLATLLQTIAQAQLTLDAVLAKANFWQLWSATPFNERQINDSTAYRAVEGKLTSKKWAAIAKCSTDTALRDITELLNLGVLQKSESGGRSTSYELSI